MIALQTSVVLHVLSKLPCTAKQTNVKFDDMIAYRNSQSFILFSKVSLPIHAIQFPCYQAKKKKTISSSCLRYVDVVPEPTAGTNILKE